MNVEQTPDPDISLDPTVVKSTPLRTLVFGSSQVVIDQVAIAAKGRGHQVFTAADIVTGIKLFHAHRPQLVITCWKLADGTGLDVARAVRRAPAGSEAHIILQVDTTTPNELATALRLGVDDCMPNPPPANLLLARLMIAEQRIADRRTQKTTRKRLRRAEAMESVATLARGIAHDINNALGPIIGYTQLVQRAFQAGEKNYERLESILRSCNRARLLVEQVLLFSRIGTAEVKSVDVLALLGGISDSMKERCAATGIQLELDLPEDLPKLPGNPQYLAEAITNIVQNAFEAMPDGGTLTIGSDCIYLDQAAVSHLERMTAGQYIMVRVTDTGTGIAPDVLPRVFDPFFTTKVRQRVTGMGLSVAQGVVQSHEGAIEVSSQPGKGTSVVVWLPLHPQRLEENGG